MVVRLPTK